MSSHARPPFRTRSGVLTTLVRHRSLVFRLIKHDIAARYRGSVMGVFWALLQPLAMLVVFTLVFGTVLKAKWAGTGGNLDFALVLFAGLLVFGVFSECLGKAPSLVTQRTNLVKKVVFPLEVLAWVSVGVASFNFAVGLAVWIAFYLALNASLHWTILFLPLVILPIIFVGVAVGWLLGALGVFLRDLEQAVAPISMAILFLSPVFFDLASVPPEFRQWFLLNPMTFAIEQARLVMLGGRLPDVTGLCIATLATYALAAAALKFFFRARGEFADAV